MDKPSPGRADEGVFASLTTKLTTKRQRTPPSSASMRSAASWRSDGMTWVYTSSVVLIWLWPSRSMITRASTHGQAPPVDADPQASGSGRHKAGLGEQGKCPLSNRGFDRAAEPDDRQTPSMADP